MKKTVTFFLTLSALLAVSCGTGNGQQAKNIDEQAIENQLQSMTLREKVGMLFNTRPEALCPEFEASGQGMYAYALQTVTEGMKERMKEYPVGGVTLFSHNIGNPEQVKAFTTAIHALPGSPMVAVDEEGGRVARVANNESFNVYKVESMAAIGASGNPQNAFDCGKAIGQYLKEYGFDIDFAPDADVNTNPQNIVIGNRAFSNDPKVAAPMVAKYLEGLESAGIVGCIKHFPGHGDTTGDSHTGYVQTEKTWDEIKDCEMVTFKAGIKAGAKMIMTAHIATPNVTGNNLPATLNPVILQDKLRSELGYQGVIITDAMGMGAISQHYSSSESAVKCFLAGADIILMPANLPEAFDAMMKAVEEGVISEDRLNESVRRILKLKSGF